MGVQVNLKHLIGAIILISAIAPTFIETTNQIHYIKPNDNTTCPLEPCQKLSYYMENSNLLESHITYYFLEGTHVLEKEGLVEIFQKTNLTLTGESIFIPPLSNLIEYNPVSRIMCTGRGGFAFLFCTDIIISNLIFVNCGAKATYFDVIHSVLYVHKIVNIITFGVVIQNSSGYGLFIYDPNGNISISHSVFRNNTGSDEYIGGNILVESLHINVDCSRQRREWTFSIESSMIAYGSNTNITTLGAGLTVLVNKWQCIASEILVNNVILVGNGGPRVFGGNLNIQVREFGYQYGNNSRISITNSIIKGGRAYVGGGMRLVITTSSCSMVSGDMTSLHPMNILNTTFISNTALEKGGGLYIKMDEICTRYRINLNNLNFTGNEVLNNIISSDPELAGDINTGVGGNIAIYTYRSTSSAPLHSIILENSVIQGGEATVGAGLAIFTLTKVKIAGSFRSNTSILPDNQVHITNTLITENSAVAGGGICIVATGVVGTSQSFIDNIQLYNSTFRKNTGYIGSAMYILTNGILPYSIQNQFLMENVSFQYNHKTSMNELYTTDFLGSQAGHAFHIDTNASATVALQGVQNITFTDCDFSDNNGTGILAIQSYVFFQGDVIFQGNTGKNGGGLSLFGSFMFPKLHTRILFLNNHAQQAGGGIHVEWEHSPLYSIYCFLQPDVDVLYHNSLVDVTVDIQIVFQSNTAEYAGSALYGGYVDQCLMINSATTDDSAARFVYLTNEVGYSTNVFNSVFKFSNDTGLSVISSNPVGVCICDQGEPQCHLKVECNSTFPGSTYEVSVVVVGQREGVVPGIVHATLSANYPSDISSFGELQTSQSVGNACQVLKYTIFSSNELENITLTVDQPAPSLKSPFLDFFTPPTLSISMLPCPAGFNLSGTPPQCNCASSLLKQNITCNITDQTIHRRAAMWIGYRSNTSDKDGVILHNHCPFDYCKQEDIKLKLSDPDEQCAFDRRGILCGVCKTGLSLALGSSQCMSCSNRYLALILAFGAAGLALVLLLTVCNLTVAEGAINGLIFYANIVHINHTVFFPQGDTSFLSVFIAWLNLDLGIQVCFYDGMDAYAKTWLQLIFPLYIWTIVIVIIIWSHYSTIVTRLISRNAVKVLATLFLLSYTKLLRVIIAALSFTVIKYPDQQETAVWLYDGNVEYLRGKHIPLFLAGVLVLCLLSLPYTFLLLLWSCLQFKNGSCRCFTTLTNRWKPLFDAYAGPYKDRYRFWTGLLLLSRNILFLIFAFNALGNPDLNLLAIGLLSNCLLMFGWGTGGVYRLQPLSILESSFFLNLAAVSLSTMYVRHAGGNQYAVAYTSAGIAFVIFAAIVLYYTLNRIRKSIHERKQYQPMLPITNREMLSAVAEQGNDQSTYVETPPIASVLRLKIENDEVILVPDNELEN